MKLKKLLKDLRVDVKGSKEIEVTGITSDSRKSAPGSLFIAKRGRVYDGAKYIPQAVMNGATAVLTDIYDPFLGKVTQILSPDIQRLEGGIVSRYYGHPSKKLFTVGITGTNGKTTTSYLLRHLLESKNTPTGLIGTIEYLVGNASIEAERTTPDVVTNHRLLRDMVNENLKAVIIEATSHALDQNRLDLIDFDAAIFLNLSQDHLDYHASMDNYLAAKQKLFTHLKKDAVAFINTDDPAQISAPCKAFTFGQKKADLIGEIQQMDRTGTTFLATYQGKESRFFIPLIGEFNVSNTLAAISVGLSRGFELDEMAENFRTFKGVPGRLQKIPGSNVYVDFAHTEDALKNTLKTLKKVAKGRVITVFGCGGDRDQDKRPKMAAASDAYSDYTFVTSDNPRTEDPEDICREIIKGFKTNHYFVDIDRRSAITRAIEMAHKEDVVLIAGKGHEKTQIFDHQTLSFDDYQVGLEALC